MGFKVIPKTIVPQWVEGLLAHHAIVGPKTIQDHYLFAEIHSAAELILDYPTTILPPKKVLLPQRETLLRFKGENGHSAVEAVVERHPTVLLGVHTCDLHAIALLDRVFMQGYADQHYQARRENLTVVSIECLAPCSEQSFCKSMGTLTVPDEFDLHLTDLGDAYAVDIGSEKGAALVEGFAGLREASEADYRRVNQVLSEKWPRFPLRLDFDVTELPGLLGISYRSALWDELGEKCLGCGMCTLVCPTCACFNVEDEVDFTLHTGQRVRVWDSCQLDQFAMVAGGHDFRSTHAARQRHRFMHKGKYQTEATGLVGCVGCGRCAQVCLVNITPIETLNTLHRRCVTIIKKHTEVRS